MDEESCTSERTVLYYTKPQKQQQTTSLFADSILIDSMTMYKATFGYSSELQYTNIDTTMDYDGYMATVTAEVDAVISTNAEDQIYSAWKKEVNIDANGILSFK